jgi:hypothetical protein
MKQKTETGTKRNETKRGVEHETTYGDGFQQETQSPGKVEQNQTLNHE